MPNPKIDAARTSGSSPTTYIDIIRKDGCVLRVFFDAADYPLVAQHRWHAKKDSKTGTFYVQTHVRKLDGTRTTKFLHQLLVPGVEMVDHRDGDGLNNRRTNLRAATNQLNQHNRNKQTNGSGFIGVDFVKDTGKYRARIKHNGKRLFLGSYANEVEAAIAYNAAAKELYGAFAKLNDIAQMTQQAVAA